MSVQGGSAEMPFIVSTTVKKTDAKTRKLIRSHVMLGKNRRKYPHSKPHESASETNESTSPEDSTLPFDEMVVAPKSVIPTRIGSDLSFVQFADNMEPYMVANVMKSRSFAKSTTIPLEACIFFDKKNSIYIQALTFDAAYLHALVFATQIYSDLLIDCTGCTTSTIASRHLSKTLQLLRERLLSGDKEAMVSNSTLTVVLTLATFAHIMKEYETAKHHLIGLRNIINLRGGLTTFKSHTFLLVEVLRCDICVALHSGAKPLFFNDPTIEPFLPYPDQTASLDKQVGFPDNIDNRLARSWEAMKNFCSQINSAAQTKRKFPEELLLNTMASVMYRLFHMKFELGSVNEALRLGVLAFSSHVFLQWKDDKRAYLHFPAAYRDCLVSLRSWETIPSRLLLWLLMIGAISVFTKDEAWLKPWLRGNIDLCGIQSWNEMRDSLDSFLWIGYLHDKPGKNIFDSAF